MKIKQIVLIFTLILFSLKSHPKEFDFMKFALPKSNNYIKNDTLKKTFFSDISKFSKAFNDGDFDEFCDMVYPKLFEFQSREWIIKIYENLRENGLLIKIDFLNIERISNLIIAEDEIFCKIYFQTKINITLSGEMLKKKEQFIIDMGNYYDNHNIKFDNKSNQLFINATKSIIAISNGDLKSWKYLENSQSHKMIMDKLLPIKVTKQFNN